MRSQFDEVIGAFVNGAARVPRRIASKAMLRLVVVAALAVPWAVAVGAELTPWTRGATPVLVLSDLKGVSHDLAAYRGKVVLVNFWATWCEPCRDEMPSLQRLEQRLAGQPFAVLAVNADEPEARIRKFLTQTSLDFTILLDPEMRSARAWNARILPTSFIVDRNGRVRYTARGDVDWTSASVISAIRGLMAPSS